VNRPESFIVPPALGDWLDGGGSFADVAGWLDLFGLRGALLIAAGTDTGLLDADVAANTAERCRRAAIRAIAGWDGPGDGPQPGDVVKLCWLADVLHSPALAKRVGPLLAEAIES